MANIIALAGRRRTGKTTVAEMICTTLDQEYGLVVKKLAFGDELKERFSKATGIGVQSLHIGGLKEIYRERLIQWADKEREKDPLVFINPILEQINILPWVVIDDLRTLEELAVLRTLKASIFKLQATEVQRISFGWEYDAEIDNHYTETELDLPAEFFKTLDGDIIYNNKTKVELSIEALRVSKKAVLKFLLSSYN